MAHGTYQSLISARITLNSQNDSEDNPEQQVQETATQSTQSQVRFQSNSTQKLSKPAHRDPVGSSQIATQEQITMQYQQIAMNAITQVPTTIRAELAMYHNQSLGSPRKDALLRALGRHPDRFATFPGLTLDLMYQELLTAIESDRERTHDNDKKRVKVNQVNLEVNSQGKKGYQ